jgi:superfamily II RNA helicase
MGEKNPPKPEGDDAKFTQTQVNSMLAEQKRKLQETYSDYDDLKAKAAKVDEAEATKKSDVDKLTEQIEELKKGHADAEARALRAEVATAKGLTAAQAKRLAGATREELEADADEIIEAFPVAASTEENGSRSRPPSRQPKPDLRGGGDPTTEEAVETDPAKLAESVPRF